MKRLILILALLAGAAEAEPPRVLTDLAPVHSLVAQVMGNLGEPVLLLDAGSDVHHVQLRPSQARAIAKADVVFWVGPGLEPWLAENLAALNSGAVSIELASEGNADAHIWLDPDVAAGWLKEIAGVLGDSDPENRETYAANSATSIAKLELLNADVTNTLTSVRDAGFVVDHDAYSSFANRFGLNILAALRDGDASMPGAARLASVRAILQNGDVACIFTDAGESGALVSAVAKGTGITVAQLDAVGFGLEPGPELYGALIRRIAHAFALCQ